MKRFYTIIQVRDKNRTPKDVIKYVAIIIGAMPEEILEDMGYNNWFNYAVVSPSDIVVARKLNDILKDADLNLRIGGGGIGIRPERSIFR